MAAAAGRLLLLLSLLPLASALSVGHVRPLCSVCTSLRASTVRGAAVESAPSIYKNVQVSPMPSDASAFLIWN
jgi:hypothetical protein